MYFLFSVSSLEPKNDAIVDLSLSPAVVPNGIFQEMLGGETEFLGQGYWRDVRLAEYRGQFVAVKTLRDTQEETRRNKERHRWEAAALEAVRTPVSKPPIVAVCFISVLSFHGRPLASSEGPSSG